MYVTFNSFTQAYVYYEAPSKNAIMKNRKEWKQGDGSLVEKLSFIDLKRNSTLHLEDIPQEEAEELKSHFLKSKVIVQ